MDADALVEKSGGNPLRSWRRNEVDVLEPKVAELQG